MVARAEGLTDEHAAATRYAEHERKQQKNNWKDRRDRAERLRRDQTADPNAGHRLRRRLQYVAQHQRYQKDEEDPPHRLALLENVDAPAGRRSRLCHSGELTPQLKLDRSFCAFRRVTRERVRWFRPS